MMTAGLLVSDAEPGLSTSWFHLSSLVVQLDRQVVLTLGEGNPLTASPPTSQGPDERLGLNRG